MNKFVCYSILTASISVGACTDRNNETSTATNKTTTTSTSSTERSSAVTDQTAAPKPATNPPLNSKSNPEPETLAKQVAAPTPTPAEHSQMSPELDLAKNSGCLACHRVDKKLVGPAWLDVAKRYAGDPDAKQKLIKKVSTGGKGNWTEVTGGIAMPAYSPRVSPENIEKLVTFVLSLQTQ